MVTIRDYANAARKKNKAEATHALCRCVFYDDMERVRQLHEMDMENNMEQALENGEFVVYLQPKVSLESGKTIGAEALVRCRTPSAGSFRRTNSSPSSSGTASSARWTCTCSRRF